MKQIRFFLVMIGLTFIGNGCAFNRANVAGLSHEQEAYFENLGKTLRNNREKLQLGLTNELNVDRARQRNLLTWERDLAKAELLLRVNANTRRNSRLLLMKSTESDLASLSQVQALTDIDSARLQAILDLYDAVINAVNTLQKNNTVITKYVGSGDAEFALRSLDDQAVVNSVSTLRDVRDQLKGVEERSAQEKIKENEHLQKDIERARDILIQTLQK